MRVIVIHCSVCFTSCTTRHSPPMHGFFLLQQSVTRSISLTLLRCCEQTPPLSFDDQIDSKRRRAVGMSEVLIMIIFNMWLV